MLKHFSMSLLPQRLQLPLLQQIRSCNYAETKGKPILPYAETEDVVEACKRQWDFYNGLLEPEEKTEE